MLRERLYNHDTCTPSPTHGILPINGTAGVELNWVGYHHNSMNFASPRIRISALCLILSTCVVVGMAAMFSQASAQVPLSTPFGQSASRQATDPRTLFVWDISTSPEYIAPGASGNIKAFLDIATEHYVYADKTSVFFSLVGENQERFEIGEPRLRNPEQHYDPFLKKTKEVYTENLTISYPISVAPETPPGTYSLDITATTQGCSSSICYLKIKTPISLTVQVGEGTRTFDWPTLSTIANGKGLGDVQRLVSNGSLLAFLLMFVGGFMTSLTPCVYPLIPVTISICGVHEGKSHWSGFTLALSYVFGMVVMYTALGIIAALSGAIFGQILANPIIIALVVFMFILFGISSLGAFDIRIPGFIEQRLMKVGGAGYVGAFIMGLVGGIIAAPCTGPVLGAALTYVSTSQDAVYGGALLFTFAWGMGILFIVIGTFSHSATKLPKSGPWMETVKSVFGIVMFGMALFFLAPALEPVGNLLEQVPSSSSWGGILVIAGILAGGVHLSFHSPAAIVKARKALGVAIATIGVFVLVNNATLTNVRPVLASPNIRGDIYGIAETEFVERVHWVTDEQEGLALAKQQRKPVMIDFWAEWCVACKELDVLTYNDEVVAKRLEDFVLIKLNYTEGTPVSDRMQSKYKIVGLPTVIFIDRDGNELPHKRLTGFIVPEEFMDHIKDIR